MKFQIRSSALSRIVGSVALLLLQFVPSAFADNNWELGKALHTANNCATSTCHAIKLGRSATNISNAIATVPRMSGYSNLTADQISDIAAYLGKTTFPVAELSAVTTSDFGSISVGLTAIRSFQLKNNGDALLRVTSVSLSETTNYTVTSDNCSGASVATGGGTCTVQITFAPQSFASFNGRTLTVSHDAIGDGTFSTATPPRFTSSVTLLGTGLAPIVVSPGTLPIGATVGSPATGDVLVTNQSSSAVTINSPNGITFSGTFASEFTRDAASTCVAGGSIAAGSNCTLRVRFDPTSASPTSRPAAVSIAHNAFGTPQSVTLQGNASAAPQGALEISASSLSFPNTQLGSTAELPLTLRNTGSAALSFSAFAIGGAHPSNFVRSGSCATATALALGAQCTLTMSFGPSALGLRSASLTINHDGSNSSAVVSLSGTGIPVPVPVAALDPAAGLNFGEQTVGGLYPARTLRLTNSGTAAMVVASIVIEGAAFANTSVAPCPASLAPAASCDIQVQFTAAGAGTGFTGAVRVTTNAAGSPHVAPLSGSGTLVAVPVLEWAPTLGQLDFGNVSVGVISPVKSATLRNAGPGGVTLTLINTIGADSSMFSAGSNVADTTACRAGRVLFKGDNCRVDVRFAPGTNGARSATLQVKSDGSSPPTLTLSGTGLSGPVPAMNLAPTALLLDTTRVGSVSAPVEVVIQSAGAGTLTVQSIRISGPFEARSKSCPAAPFTLAAGSACAITVTFLPQGEGDASGTLTVVSDSSPAGKVVALTARAEARVSDGGGGCSMINAHSPADPTLWSLVLLAFVALFSRQRQRHHAQKDGGQPQ